MKINPKIGADPKVVGELKFAAMKKLIKVDLRRLEKNTTIDSPTLFMMIGMHDYPDKKQVALPILGRQAIAWKQYVKNIVQKLDTGVLGRVYYQGVNTDGQKVVVFDVAKGKGKGKINKLEKGLKKLVSQSTYQLIFNEVDEKAFDDLEAKLDAAGDTLDTEIEELAEFDEGDVEVDKNQSYDLLLASNLTKLSAQFVPIKNNVANKVQNDPEDIELLVDYAQEWLELYTEADADANAKYVSRVQQVKDIKAFAEKLLGVSTAAPQLKTASAPVYDASKKALEVGLEMADKNKNPQYQAGHVYIPYTGKASGKKYKPGEKLSDEDKKFYNPTWCNQFAYDMTEKVVGNNSPFNFLPAGKGWTNANALYQFAADAEGVLFDEIGKFEEAWQLANAGKMVYFLSKAKIGHVSTAAPTPADKMVAKYGDKFGMVIQAGASVGHMHIFKVWADPAKSGVKIFLSRINEPLPAGQQQDPNIFLKIYKTIDKPVGKGYEMDTSKGPQRHIKTVQQLLVNAGENIGTGGQFKNGVDGYCTSSSSKVIKAIENIQRKMVAEGIATPISGFVAMNDATWNYLYGKSKAVIEAPVVNPNEGLLNDLPNNTGGGDTPTGGSDISSTVQKGSKGADVITVQKLLLKNGADLGKWGADGDAGTATDTAIRNFQTQKGLDVTGKVEPNSPTWLALKGETPQNTTVKPEDVQISTGAGVSGIPAAKLQVLKEILAKAGETTAKITSYARTADEQARIMYNNIVKDGEAKNRQSYKNPAAAASVVDAFMTALKAGKNGGEIYAAVLAAVNKAGAANLSDHCAANPAIDIDPASLKNKGSFETALKADSRVQAIIPPADPFYHLIIA
jgi:peptidoglycan hydrolase-like protein with peptidoglycan-binding domain